MRCIRVLLVLVTATGWAGCSATFSHAPAVGVSGLTLHELSRNEYVITDTVEGHGSVTTVLGFIPFGDSNFGFIGSLARWEEIDNAVASATYDAISKAPNADTILPLRTTVSRSGIPFLVANEEATVWGKAVRIKTDKESFGK